MKISRIDLNPVGGVAGDMFSAAMINALPELQQPVQSDIASLGIDGLSANVEPITSASLSALRFAVTQPKQPKPPRTLAQVQSFLRESDLSSDVAKTAGGIYRLLAQAEAAVHGKTIETIHFHEVSDWDSMVDIVSAARIITDLPNVNWRIAPLPLGGGTVNTAHGAIPVPAPATVELLKEFEWVDDGVSGERVTPTGAAILKYLAPQSSQQPAPAARLHATGSGAGTRTLPGRANILRATVFASSRDSNDELIEELAFEIDDMTSEEIAAAVDKLRTIPTVLDISLLSMQGKKGRTMTGVRLLVDPVAADSVTTQCFEQTSTLGVRRASVRRQVLPRESTVIDGIGVKRATRPNNVVSAKAESDDLAQASNLTERRALALDAQQRATDQQSNDDA